MVLGFCLVCDPGEGVEGCCPAFLGIVKDGTLDPELLAACMRPACAAGSLSSFCGGFCPKTAQLSIPAQTRCEETPRHTLALLDSTAAECAFTANVRVRPLFLGSAVASQFTLMPYYKCQHLLDHHSLGFCRRNDTEAAKRLIEQAHLRRPVLCTIARTSLWCQGANPCCEDQRQWLDAVRHAKSVGRESAHGTPHGMSKGGAR